jgi:hypothetical protein
MFPGTRCAEDIISAAASSNMPLTGAGRAGSWACDGAEGALQQLLLVRTAEREAKMRMLFYVAEEQQQLCVSLFGFDST